MCSSLTLQYQGQEILGTIFPLFKQNLQNYTQRAAAECEQLVARLNKWGEKKKTQFQGVEIYQEVRASGSQLNRFGPTFNSHKSVSVMWSLEASDCVYN